MVNPLHQGLKVRNGGASKADVEAMLQKIDGDGDGKISQGELSALAKQGRDRGFADQGSMDMFRAGLDAGGLAEVKSQEKGQQFSPEYIDGKMKPLLEKSYGKDAGRAADIVAPQASRELTQDSAKRFENRSGWDKFQRGAIKDKLNPGDHLQDTNGNKQVDAEIEKLIYDGKGGYRYMALGQKEADDINKSAMDAKKREQTKTDETNTHKGLDKAKTMFDGKPAFPGDGSELAKKSNQAAWLGGKSKADGGDWNMEPIKDGPGKGYNEYKLDPNKSASKALDGLINNPKDSCMDCAMAKQVAQYQRVRQNLGDEAFDKLAKKEGMTIGHSDAAYRSGLLAKLTSPVANASTDPKDYKEGMQGYAKVTVPGKDAMKKLNDAGWSGEHFTVMNNEKGEKQILAHPFGAIPADKFDQSLREKIAKTAGVPEDKVQIEYRPPIDVDLEYARKLANQ